MCQTPRVPDLGEAYKRQCCRGKMDPASAATSRERTDRSRVRLPLNSRRLTAVQLKRVGEALGVPTAAAAEEVRQMIEAKLAEDEHEPRNVQVVLEDSSPNSGLTLQDDGGTFLVIQPEERPLQLEDPGREDGSTPEEALEQADGPLEVGLLRASLGEASAEINTLKADLQTLRAQLQSEKARVREMW